MPLVVAPAAPTAIDETVSNLQIQLASVTEESSVEINGLRTRARALEDALAQEQASVKARAAAVSRQLNEKDTQIMSLRKRVEEMTMELDRANLDRSVTEPPADDDGQRREWCVRELRG